MTTIMVKSWCTNKT